MAAFNLSLPSACLKTEWYLYIVHLSCLVLSYLNNNHVVISHYLYICSAQCVTVHAFLNINTYFISLRHDHLSAAYNPSRPSKPLTVHSKSDIYSPITKLIHIHFWLNQPPSSTIPYNTVELHWCHFSQISSSRVLKICKIIWYHVIQYYNKFSPLHKQVFHYIILHAPHFHHLQSQYDVHYCT